MLEVADRLAIHELAARYGNVIDARAWDRLDEVFSDDAVFRLDTVASGDTSRWDGLDAIRAMLIHAEHPVAHHVTNVEVVDTDPVRLLFKVAGPGRRGAVGSADYDDRLVLGPRGWRLHDHHATVRTPSVDRSALARVQAELSIQQLPVRYAQAVDSRDLDLMAELWVPDAWMGKACGAGPEAVKAFFRPLLTSFYRSIHMIVGHRIDIHDNDNATGHVYCRAEHESGSEWVVQAIVYQDTYRRVDGQWGFVKRHHCHWYTTPVEVPPTGPTFESWPGVERDWPLPDLPQSWPSWRAFWAGAGPDAIDAVTNAPDAPDGARR